MPEHLLPMSSTQQGMYFDCQLRQAADYHVALDLLTDPIDPDRLRRAIEVTMAEQPALRASIVATASGPAYAIAETVEAPVSQYGPRDSESDLNAILRQARQKPFHLEKAPLFRVVTAQTGDGLRLLVVCHHLIADGHSISILVDRILRLARTAGEIPGAQLDQGMVVYQEGQVVEPSPKAQERRENFWNENLARHEAPRLGHWLHRPSRDDAAREVRLSVPYPTAQSVREVAREAEVSELSVYLAAFGLLLSHYSGEDQVSFGSPFIDRPHLEMDSSVGCFIRTLPVRVDANPEQTVQELLTGVRAEIMSLWRHLDFPVASKLARLPSADLLDITFIHDAYPALPPGVRTVIHPGDVYFPGNLTVSVEQLDGTTDIVVWYKQSALTSQRATQFAERFLDLIQQITVDVAAPVATLRPTSTAECAELLVASRATHHYDWEPTDLGTLFLSRTESDPAKEAWFDRERSYTNAWAHDAAVLVQRRLVEASGESRSPVAILLPREATLLAAVFGAVLAGRPYVPMSEQMPATRIAEILDDAEVTTILTYSNLRLDLPAGVRRINLDECDELASLNRDDRAVIQELPVVVERKPQDLLYIEYTSGSTGRPKGVAISHANVQNTALDLERRSPLGNDDVFLLKTSFTFDIFGTEIYGWLFGQGRLAVLPAGQEMDPQALARAVRGFNVTHLNMSPTLLRVLLASVAATDSADDLSGLTYLFCGGEALTPDIIEQFFALNLPCTLENVYGPTEATMWATHTRIHPGDTQENAPIGLPLNDYRVYILNRQGQLCGTDLPGEVCIAGAGVGRGYLNREDLTARQFVTNPFYDAAVDSEAMRRMYRTGDLGFLRSDGRFAFLGRMDRQVKVGGIRVELGEIEQAMQRVDGVVEVAALVDDSMGEPRLVGFYAAKTEISPDAIRAELTRTLISQFVPSLLIQVEALPTSAAGKLDRAALRALIGQPPVGGTEPIPSGYCIERLEKLWQGVLGRPVIDRRHTFFESGGTSLSLMRLQIQIQEAFGVQITITDLLSHPTIAAQAELLNPGKPGDEKEAHGAAAPGKDIAIIGIGLQVPGATGVHEFWDLLTAGQESITFYDDEELRAFGIDDSQLRHPDYVKASGSLQGIDGFDDRLFGLSPAEVDITSPQLRLLYECFWLACEDAGYDPRRLPGRVGVFAAGSDDFEWYRRTVMNGSSFGDAYQGFTLATNHFLSTRLSYHFDLTGPSLSALTGCSSSLMTVHLAIQALRSGECDMAVAGGVTVELPNGGGYRWVDGMMLSRDGHCRPFDADASGTVFSNGAALVVLKPLAAALRDEDPVYAVIKGSATGNDGRRKQSYTAPSEDGQYETIATAYRTAGIDPATVTFVEAHGTGTLLGDPIEVASLTRAFASSPTGSCLLGSVKGNVGHTDSAAGAVGLAKVALSLKHRMLPGTVNFATPNPHVDFGSTPFVVTAENRAFDERPLRAGINSFGVGGTNVHMIVDEAPPAPDSPEDPEVLLQFSAATPEALDRTAGRLLRRVAANPAIRLSDVAATLRSRAELPCRGSVVVPTGEGRDTGEWMRRLDRCTVPAGVDAPRRAFLFSGQGNQYHRMGYGLYTGDGSIARLFRQWMDRLIELLPGDDAAEFRDVLYGDGDDGRIHRTEWSQYALFSTQFAIAKVLESFGVVPDIMVGHSIGELTAATLAGVWNLEDAALLVRRRGQLMQAQEPGVMVAALAPAAQVAEALADMPDAWLSLDNSPQRSVVGMAPHAFDAVLASLDDAGIAGVRIQTSHAFHTPMMDNAAAAFAATVATVAAQEPTIPIISNRTGKLVRPGEMTGSGYWGDHITGAVRFTDSIATLLAAGPVVGIETGPGRSLATFVSQCDGGDVPVASMMRHGAADVTDLAQLLAGLGTLWGAGVRLGWDNHPVGRRVSLPGYSFDDHPHPVSGGHAATAPEPGAIVPQALPGNRVDAIREAFRRVLGHDEVSATDDFFALGGDSLKATSLAAQIRMLLGVDASVADVFAAATPAALSARLPEGAAGSVMAKAPEATDYPVSPAQERMYLASRLDPASSAYNMASVTWLDGRLDHDRVRSALERLVRRHEPLRTVFDSAHGEIRQRLRDITDDLPLRFTRGEATPEAAPGHLHRFVRPFDLHAGPLFRMEIVEGPTSSLLLFDIHHIVADATSAEVLARDFGQLYDGDLTPLSYQYTDYVHHMRTVARTQTLMEAEEALLHRLACPPSSDVLPLDHPRGEQALGAARVDWTLSPERTAEALRLAEANQATLSMVMLAAWGAVLSRYNGSEDVIICTPASARTLAETREMVGMFVNMLPVRLTPRGDASFESYLADTRETVLEALAGQDIPFERIVQRLGLERTLGRHPLSDISFDFHNIEHHDLAIGGLTAQQIEVAPLAVGLDLVITGRETSQGIRFQLDYASSLFGGATIQALVRHFDAFLERVCSDPATPTGHISIYSEADHDEWRARLTGAAFVPIHDHIAQRAIERPEAIAVVDGDGTAFTFAQIDSWANAVAAHLVHAGLQAGDPVVLVTERTVNLLVAQLAICKAGGAYVPLDPAQPADRHARILADVQPRFAVAAAGFAATASIPTVIDINTCANETAERCDLPRVMADDPVYIVYTSGSTGTPKGIAVKHRGVANLFQDHQRREIFAPGDVIISLADPTFDIFAFESLIPLAAGATVHMCPACDQKDAAAVARRISAYQVSHIQMPVSKMSAFCGNRRFREQLPRLRAIVCGGEHFSKNLVELLHGSTNARVFNMYGPTETTVTTTVKELRPGDAITIGSPIFGSHLMVVGESGMARPTGVPGELCVAGQGLAAGYVNRPEETRRVFTTVPELPGVTVYRTGDIGTQLPNGEIALKGRTDHQVKINGNRIELGEIEQTVMRAPGVTYAVALVENGDIACYFTTDGSVPDPDASIRSTIAASLPAYMIPRFLREVPDMPRLHNTKIDRSALTAIRGAQPAAQEPSDTLGVITDAWEHVLGQPVSPDDNFFDIGGSSFKLMLVNNHLNDVLDRDIPLVRLFEFPTPRSLATNLNGAIDDDPDPVEGVLSISDLSGFDQWAQPRNPTSMRIAVVGVAGVFPGADSVAEHWDKRAAGVVSIRRFSRDELLASGIDETVIDHPDYVPARGHVPADTFDSELFSYSRAEAESMDPQLRLLHQTAWHALEDAGYDPRRRHGDIALFAGSGTNFAWLAGLLRRNPDPMAAFEALTRNEKDFLATRVAYKLNLTGPAITVQTACSTSLVAIHEAVACLRRGEADMALAGGVALNFPRAEGYLWHDGMIFSPDGVCRPFSADASGTVAGQGCGMVLLKPFDQALSDGDHIYAVIAGTAVNNDGDAKVGYTAPGVTGQEKVIREALADAGANPDEVGFVETHGTGTTLGDPIEYAALSQIYGQDSPCALGAVKANIGHLDAAAGIAGFLGAVGVLYRQQIPPMANFSGINRAIVPAGNIHVPVDAPIDRPVRKAAVSSFGIGGTNAHVILEAAPAVPDDAAELEGAVVLAVSAMTDEARSEMQRGIEAAIASGSSLRDTSYTLATGRSEFRSRAAAVVRPGQPVVWLEPGSPAVLVDASDDIWLNLADGVGSDDALTAEVWEHAERLLSGFDAGARRVLEEAFTRRSHDGSVGVVAQYVLRVALLAALGKECLGARTGQDRLLRVARAQVSHQLDTSQALAELRNRTVSVPGAPTISGATMCSGPITGDVLRSLLASSWVRGDSVARDGFHRGGRRISLPGYAFARKRLLSDVRMDQLLGAPKPSPMPEPGSVGQAGEVLRDAWTQVLGTEPSDNDDFLVSGGDSLAAVRLCAIVKERTGQSLTVRDIFSAPAFGALAERLAGSEAQPDDPRPSHPVAACGVHAASPAQRRMYAMCALQEDTTAYNLAISYKANGRLDIARLRRACQALVARHDQLRASFHLEGSELVMKVHDEVPDVVTQEHMTRGEAKRRIAAEPEPFDLGQAPLFRVEVLSVDESEHYLRLDLHHIVGDQTSLAVLGKDLASAWSGRDLGPAPMSYAECTTRMGELAASGAFAEDVAFFRRLIADAPTRLELPYDHQPPENPSFAGERLSLTCAVDKQALAQLAAASRATPYAVFLTAVARVLGLHSGQEEFILGTALSGRTLAGSEGTVGMFVNTLPLRLRATSGRSVRETVSDTHGHAAEVLSHQNAPFEQVLADSGIAISEHSHPLFDVLVSFVTMGTEDPDIEGVELEALPPGALRSRFPLSLSIAEHAGHYRVQLEYRTELFDAKTIATMAQHLDRLLVEMVKDADRRFVLVPLESEAERARRRAAMTGGGSSVETALDVPLQESFVRYRELPAVRWEGQEWTYGDVERITDEVAGGLQAAGVRPGDVVGVIIERGPWQVWTRIALMRSGAVELPLDPEAPVQRVNQTLSDAGARIVLCDDNHALTLPDAVAAYHPSSLTGEFEPPQGLGPTSPLILIYTSGTTGQPKGVRVTHGGVLSACVDTGYLDHGPGDRIVHLSGYTFDPSMLDVYSALLTGATVVMGSHAHSMDMRLLAELLTTEQVTKGLFITAIFHLLMAENPEAIAGMSAVYVGGEALQPWAAQRAWKVLGPGRLFNLYGPTEVSICSTFFRVDEYPDFERMPIGGPSHNRELFVVHPDGTDLPRGVAGELCIAGPGLALGYHDRDELTAERFPRTLGALGTRVYRTGDRVILDDQCRVIYLDRIDRQVKHAGYRIELSEIENVASRHPDVTEAIVVHTSTGANDSRLLGFYTGQASPDDVRSHLRQALPAYMVPQRFTKLREVPLTRHGKVDRNALLAMVEDSQVEPEPRATADSPQGILHLARTALGLPDLRPDSNFFASGAQSIQAIALTRRLRESGFDAQVSDLYRYPSAELLAEALGTCRRTPVPTAPVASREDTRRLGQQRLRQLVADIVADACDLADAYAVDAPSYRFEAGALARLHTTRATIGGFVHTVDGVEATALLEALGDLVMDHEMLRARGSGDWFDVISAEAVEDLPVLIRVHDLTAVADDQIGEVADAVAHELTRVPFDGGLLWRCALLAESAHSVRLIWAFHHSIFDGFSARLLNEELGKRGRGAHVPAPQRYSDFLAGLTPMEDWNQELEEFDYSEWIASNEAVTAAVSSGSLPRRMSLPLDGRNPLSLALHEIHDLLAGISSQSRVGVGMVSDCRNWRGADYSSCFGEFLDAVPVMLTGRDDQSTVAARLSRVRDRGLHYLHSLGVSGSRYDGSVERLRDLYYGADGRFGFVLINFQGYIPPGDVPAEDIEEAGLAMAQVNVWYDDEELHLQWIAEAAELATGARA